MKLFLHRHLLLLVGFVFVALGVLGLILPVLPTTPFLLVALACFSKSSPRFYKMLLCNAWVGPTLVDWEENRALSRKIKYRAILLIIMSFAISIMFLSGKLYLQLMLLVLGIFLVCFIWHLNENPK
ncbi:MAG: YbaN family protein [Desulfotalea sp.]